MYLVYGNEATYIVDIEKLTCVVPVGRRNAANQFLSFETSPFAEGIPSPGASISRSEDMPYRAASIWVMLVTARDNSC